MSEIVYRWLLKLYPRRFRDEYGDAMMQLFQDRFRADDPGRVRVWIDTVGDLIVTVPREHRRNLSENPHTRPAAVLLILIAVPALIWYANQPGGSDPSRPMFAAFPRILGDWRTSADLPIDAGVREILGADELLSRFYAGESDMDRAHLFLARFARTSLRPHSRIPIAPSRWKPAEPPGTISISVPGQSMHVAANRWVVTNGVEQSVVLYWYQTKPRYRERVLG